MIPNPEVDSIGLLSYTIFYHKPPNYSSFSDENDLYETNLIIYDKEMRSLQTSRFTGLASLAYLTHKIKKIDYVHKEEDLFSNFIKAIHFYNPDILVGYEIQKLSWCFLIKRAMRLNINEFCLKLSRLPKSKRDSGLKINVPKKAGPGGKPVQDAELNAVPYDIAIGGRVVLNLWRILRSEISLNIYTFENCCFHILNERVPKYSYSTLTSWFIHKSDLYRWKTIEYFYYRSRTNIRLINSLDLIGKTCEFAKVYGIEFYHVLSRGSQYRVESMMLRIAHKLNYVAFSANQKQKMTMRAAECIPLTLEPESKFYTDPIAVLDFQSLYPSVIIAYNICFTTCLGRVESVGKEGCFKFGCGSLFVPDSLIKTLDFERDVYIAPNGVAFVKQHIRKGMLDIVFR